jgi:hypothetical protein
MAPQPPSRACWDHQLPRAMQVVLRSRKGTKERRQPQHLINYSHYLMIIYTPTIEIFARADEIHMEGLNLGVPSAVLSFASVEGRWACEELNSEILVL